MFTASNAQGEVENNSNHRW